jgi:hypothetical protein
VGVDSAKYDGMVIGDKYSFLNFEIAEKVQPIWTLAAKKLEHWVLCKSK